MSMYDPVLDVSDSPSTNRSASSVPVIYHYAAFRVNKEGQSAWFDGVVELNAEILSQDHYLALKKLLTSHYDIPETNFVITSLTQLGTAFRI